MLADLFKIFKVLKYAILEDTARYAGLLPAPAESFGQGFFWPLAKKWLIMLFGPILGHFWCSAVTLVTLSSNLDTFFFFFSFLFFAIFFVGAKKFYEKDKIFKKVFFTRKKCS